MAYIVKAVFGSESIVKTDTIYQYNSGQVLQVEGLAFTNSTEFHLAIHGKDTASIITGTIANNIAKITIPEVLMINDFCTCNYRIDVFVYVIDNDSGYTKYKIIIPVKSRPRPKDYYVDLPTVPELKSLKQELNTAVNNFNDAYTGIDQLKSETALLKENIIRLKGERVSILSATESGTISATTGSDISYGGKKRSGYIAISKGELLHLRYSNDVSHAMIAFYDSNKLFVSAVKGDGNTLETIVESPCNGYFRFTCWESALTDENCHIFFTNDNEYQPTYREYKQGAYSGSKIINSASIGEKISFTSNVYRSLVQVLIPKNCIGVYFNACRVGDTDVDVCVTDSDYNVLYTKNFSDKTNNTMGYVNVSKLNNAKYVFFPVLQNNIYPYTTVFFDYGKYIISCGEQYPLSISGFVKIGNSYFVAFNKGTLNTATISFNSIYCHSIALEARIVSLTECSNTESIVIEYYNGSILVTKEKLVMPDAFQTGEFIRIKTHTLNKIINNAKIIVNFKSSATADSVVNMEIKDTFTKNHYTKPIMMINFDHTWKATEQCGAYDYLKTHNIPFTITGNIGNESGTTDNPEKEISDDAKTLLSNLYLQGILDVGIYGGEKSTENMFDRFVKSVTLLDSRMDNIINEKIEKGYYPTVFAPTNHLISRYMQKSLENKNFTIVRVGDVHSGGITFPNNLHYVTVGYGYGNALLLGNPCIYFTHGVSNNKSEEITPSLYDTWTSFKYMIDVVKKARTNNECYIMTMHDYFDFLNRNNLIN